MAKENRVGRCFFLFFFFKMFSHFLTFLNMCIILNNKFESLILYCVITFIQINKVF